MVITSSLIVTSILSLALISYSFFVHVSKPMLFGPLFYFMIAAYTFVGLSFGFAEDIPFDFFNLVSEADIAYAIASFFLSSAAMTAGILISHTRYIQGRTMVGSNSLRRLGGMINGMPTSVTFGLSLAWISVYPFSYGISALLYRDTYIPQYFFTTGVKVSMLLLPISAFACALQRNTITRATLFILFLCVLIGSSSRMVAIFIVFFLAGRLLLAGKIRWIQIALFSALLLWLTSFSLVSRHLSVQGIIPNIASLISTSSIDLAVYAINYLLSFSVGILAYSNSIYITHDIDQLVRYALSPLPSFFHSDVPVFPNLLGTAPYSTFAVVFSKGFVTGSIFFFACGITFGLLHRFFSRRNYLLWCAFCLCYLLFCVYSTQYYLRDSTRFVYYPIYLAIITLCYSTFRILASKKTS